MSVWMESQKNGETVREESFKGCVLETRERNYHDDSDFYAVVWSEEKQAVTEVQYATTRGWTYNNSATVDATPEVLVKAGEWAVKRAFEALKLADKAEAAKPAKGKVVTVVRGGKVQQGTTGEVIWIGAGKAYSWSQAKYGTPQRVGIKDATGEVHWTAASNVEVQSPEQYETPESVLAQRAERFKSDPSGFYSSMVARAMSLAYL